MKEEKELQVKQLFGIKVAQNKYDTIEQASRAIEQLNPSRIFLVTGNGSFESSGAAKKLYPILKKYKHQRFSDFSPNPKIEDSERGIELYNRFNPDYIIGVGGGSAIDMSELITGLAPEIDPKNALIQNKPLLKPKRMMAIPTTSGSGSESTPFAVGYVDGTKYSYSHPELLPQDIVLNPGLTYSMTPQLTSITGWDALCQALESYWSVNSTPNSRFHSRLAAIKLISNLENAVNNPNPINRESMQRAANLAGLAIAEAKTTAPHALSYTMASKYGVPHGWAVALTLPEFFEFNNDVDNATCNHPLGAFYVKNTMFEISKLFGTKIIPEAKQKMIDLMKATGAPITLKEAGVSNLNLISNSVNIQRLGNNPRKTTTKDIKQILTNIQ
jgi:alcohol dehydrogenase